MAAYLTLRPKDHTLADILKITIPAGIVSCIVTALVQQRIGKELWAVPEYPRRVEAGEVELPDKIRATLPEATRTAAIAAATARQAASAAAGGTTIAVVDQPSAPTELLTPSFPRYLRSALSSWPAWPSSS